MNTTCKDCIHYDACKDMFDGSKEDFDFYNSVPYCTDVGLFKDKSRYIELPCAVGQKVYVITSQTSDNRNFYMFEDIITHYCVYADCSVMCFENHMGVPDWNWDKVFLTKEDAEKALKGGVE